MITEVVEGDDPANPRWSDRVKRLTNRELIKEAKTKAGNSRKQESREHYYLSANAERIQRPTPNPAAEAVGRDYLAIIDSVFADGERVFESNYQSDAKKLNAAMGERQSPGKRCIARYRCCILAALRRRIRVTRDETLSEILVAFVIFLDPKGFESSECNLTDGPRGTGHVMRIHRALNEYREQVRADLE
ncbi:MAG: hypothetical protein JNJ88_07240 [Planctomycetes bacterium]|nr:hypothetical protein [Planctomycetota bacterium]